LKNNKKVTDLKIMMKMGNQRESPWYFPFLRMSIPCQKPLIHYFLFVTPNVKIT